MKFGIDCCDSFWFVWEFQRKLRNLIDVGFNDIFRSWHSLALYGLYVNKKTIDEKSDFVINKRAFWAAKMVYIHIPEALTEEEQMLMAKYSKLKKKVSHKIE